MIHTSLPRNCVVFLLLRELTQSAIYVSQKFDSHKWPTVLVDEVKRKLCNFEACFCGSLYSTFTTSFYSYAFHKKQLQTLFKDQLDRSKATCSFNCVHCKFEQLCYQREAAHSNPLFRNWVNRVQYTTKHLMY